MASYLQAKSNLEARNGVNALPIHSADGSAVDTIPISFSQPKSSSSTNNSSDPYAHIHGNHHAPPTADHIDHGVTQAPYEKSFSPYDFNGGTTLAISGVDYAVVAADTRMSTGYEILSRNVTKLHALTDCCVLGSAGCKTDIDQLRSVLDIKMKVRFILKFCHVTCIILWAVRSYYLYLISYTMLEIIELLLLVILFGCVWMKLLFKYPQRFQVSLQLTNLYPFLSYPNLSYSTTNKTPPTTLINF